MGQATHLLDACMLPGQDAVDEWSHIFFLEEYGCVTASVRYVYMTDQCCPQLHAHSKLIVRKYFDDDYLEMSRLLVGLNFRGSNRVNVLLHASTRWLLEHVGDRRYFALCSRGLLGLYRRYGAVCVDQRQLLRRNGKWHPYCLVHGTIQDVFEISRQVSHRLDHAGPLSNITTEYDRYTYAKRMNVGQLFLAMSRFPIRMNSLRKID